MVILMKNKITNEYVDKCLVNRNIKRIDECTSCIAKYNWQCLVCGGFWITSVNKIINTGHGCHNCNLPKKLTIERVGKELKNKNIIIVNDFYVKDFVTTGTFHCQTCSYKWESSVGPVFRKGKCPSCSKRASLTNDIVDRRLLNSKIKRIGDVLLAKTKIDWRCLDCDNVWSARPDNIFHGKGCPPCGGSVPLSNEIVDERIKDRKIKRLDDYVHTHFKINWQCLKCDHKWLTTPHGVMTDGTGCPKCHKLRKNETIVYDYLKAKNINFESQKDIRQLNTNESNKYRLDFYLPNHSIIIEYNGGQHYHPVIFHAGMTKEDAKESFEKQILRDAYVREFCKNNGLKLIEIDGRIYNYNKLITYLNQLFSDIDSA